MTTLEHITQLEQQATRQHGTGLPTYIVLDEVRHAIRVEVRLGPGGARYVALVPGAVVEEPYGRP